MIKKFERIIYFPLMLYIIMLFVTVIGVGLLYFRSFIYVEKSNDYHDFVFEFESVALEITDNFEIAMDTYLYSKYVNQSFTAGYREIVKVRDMDEHFKTIVFDVHNAPIQIRAIMNTMNNVVRFESYDYAQKMNELEEGFMNFNEGGKIYRAYFNRNSVQDILMIVVVQIDEFKQLFFENVDYLRGRINIPIVVRDRNWDVGYGQSLVVGTEDNVLSITNKYGWIFETKTELRDYTTSVRFIRRLGLMLYFFIFYFMIMLIKKIKEIRAIEYKNLNMEKSINQRRKELLEKNRELSHSMKEVELIKHNLAQSNSALKSTNVKLKLTQKALIESDNVASLGQMLGGAVHEIYTPITRIEQIIDKAKGKLNEFEYRQKNNSVSKAYMATLVSALQENMENAEYNLGRTMELVDDYSVVASEIGTDLEKEFNVVEFVNKIIVGLDIRTRNPLITAKVEAREDLSIFSYPSVLAQIIITLINNSLIHGFAEGASGGIWIIVSKEQDTVQINYMDDGVGIADSIIDHIFDPFVSTRGLSNNKEGAGLGLSMLYNLVTIKLRGEIEVENRPLHGVEFRVRIPVK